MARVRIGAVQHQAGAAESLARLPSELLRALYERLDDYVGQELDVGTHVQWLKLEDRRIRVNFFVDTDGTLWVERLATEA